MHKGNLFKADDLIRARESLARVTLLKEQRKIVDQLVQVALNYIEMEELAMRGFFLMAIQEWQKKRMVPIGEFRTMIPEARKKYVTEMFHELERILLHTLNRDAYIPLIKRAVKESLDYYVSHFAYRAVAKE
ncbi:hypothetical protein [Candidatus Harpocratesius sp.]